MLWSRDLNKENIISTDSDSSSARKRQLRSDPNDTKNQRIKHSSSLLSLRNFTGKRVSIAPSVPVISQPTLNESSHEKLRNKIKHSPSFLSINGLSGHTERHSEAEKRVLDSLLDLSNTGEVGDYLDPEELRQKNPSTLYYVTDLSHHIEAVQTVKTIEIHRILTSPGFLNFNTIALVPLDPVYTSQLRCILGMEKKGVSLNEFIFENSLEAVEILMRITEMLASAENKLKFEHRNLHAGNILIDRSPADGRIDSVSIISCDLARVSTLRNGLPEVLFTPLDNPKFYKPRLPVLSQMRDIVHDPSDFVPATNVLWLKYLARFLYNKEPSALLKKMEETLNPRWVFQKPPRSAMDALQKLKRKTQTLI